jgi:putative drug exporter of the RND superfamily
VSPAGGDDRLRVPSERERRPHPLAFRVQPLDLSMDYEVFLLTRIRERWLVHGDNERAVAEGLVGSARTITSAAAVMVAVFAAFAVAGAPSLKELGAGLAVAIFLDASLIRLVVVPAAMRLLGDWNWWMPGALARLLPAAGH